MILAPVLGNVVWAEETNGAREGQCSETPSSSTRKAQTHLQQSNGNVQRSSSAPQRSLIVRDGPGVPLEALKDGRQLELALLDRHEEPARSKALRRQGLTGTGDRSVGRVEAEHVGDLLGRVVLGASENVGLGARGVAELVHLSLREEQPSAMSGPLRQRKE